MSDKNPVKKGSKITISSLSQIRSTFAYQKKNTKYYQLESDLPISVHYSYFALPFTDSQASSSEDENERSGSKRRRHSDHDEPRDFWQDNFASLPDSMTRVPRTETLRNQQHLKMVDMLHTGKASLVAARAELELVKVQMKALREETDRLRGEKLELQMKSDMLARKVRSSPELIKLNNTPPKNADDDDTNVGASTSKDAKIKQEYQIPEGFDRNESILNNMADTTFQRNDPSIVAAKKGETDVRPRPLMALKVTPPSQGTKRNRDDGGSDKDDNQNQGLGSFWNVTGQGPFVLHTHSKPRMGTSGGNVVGRGGIVGLSQGMDGIARGGSFYGRGYGVAGPYAGFGNRGNGSTFMRAGVGHGHSNRAPYMGMGGIGRGIGFKISPPKPRLPMATPIRVPSIFDESTTTAPATTTTMSIFGSTGSSSSAAAGSSSSSGQATKDSNSKPKRTRSTKKTTNSPAQKPKHDECGDNSDSDHSVLRLDLSEHDEAFFIERESDLDLELPDYEDAY